MSGTIAGVDIGGTRIKVAIFSEDGALLEKQTCDTQDASTAGHPPRFAQHVQTILAKLGPIPARVGIAAPGLAAGDGFSIAHMPGRLQGLEGFVWSQFLNVPVRVLNDAHAALLGEAWRGAARGLENVILLTLGTGVGGAILTNGRLLKGVTGRAGHFGHICLDPRGAPDIANTPGSLEDAVGDASLRERSSGRFTSTRALVEAFRQGDPDARKVWLGSVRTLGCAVSSLVNILDPEAVVMGGGIALAGESLFEPLAEILEQTEWRPAGHRVRIVPAELGEWAGAYGAAWNVKFYENSSDGISLRMPQAH